MNKRIHLFEIAYARSGDKGNDANIGLIAYKEKGYQFLQEMLSAENVLAFFKPLLVEKVIRYELPNLWALNFLLIGALGGGGSLSLRTDAQGKVLGQLLLEMEIEVPKKIFEEIKKEI